MILLLAPMTALLLRLTETRLGTWKPACILLILMVVEDLWGKLLIRTLMLVDALLMLTIKVLDKFVSVYVLCTEPAGFEFIARTGSCAVLLEATKALLPRARQELMLSLRVVSVVRNLLIMV